jgi:trehalose 6-phosphate synthase/phosphatase
LNQHLSEDTKLILSIDRMDYTKGIPNRIKAFEYFLDHYPEFKEKVRLIMLAVPSRSDVPQYQNSNEKPMNW